MSWQINQCYTISVPLYEILQVIMMDILQIMTGDQRQLLH